MTESRERMLITCYCMCVENLLRRMICESLVPYLVDRVTLITQLFSILY